MVQSAVVESVDLITPQQAQTLFGLFVQRVQRTPQQVAYRYWDSVQQQWLDYTWQQMAQQTARWQQWLKQLNLSAGDRVGIMVRNCPQWIMFDQAALSLGLVVVPLYTMDRAENVAYIAQHAGIRVLLFETQPQWQALQPVMSRLEGVSHFIALQSFTAEHSRLYFAEQVLPPQAMLDEAIHQSSDQLASLIYTSGTTGKPKGVMLSHANMLSNAYACLQFFPVDRHDLLLSFLPLSHTFERTVGYYLTVMAGARVAFARSIPQLSEDLQQIRPTLLVSVPRIYERIYATVQEKLRNSGVLSRALFALTVRVGWQRFLWQQGRAGWRPGLCLWPLLHRLVARQVLSKLGGNLRAALSGGAALSPTVARVFIGLGLPVIQGYGMTETSPVICANWLQDNYPESVGRPVQDMEIRLSDQEELLVRGPNVMLGYWNNAAATEKMIDADGWLNTGDKARIDSSGHIYITGRTKEIIVMSNGEKIPPADMEMAIQQDRCIEQVMVVGESRPYLTALVVLNELGIQQLAAGSQQPVLAEATVQEQILNRVKQALAAFPGYAKIHQVTVLTQPWTIEQGLLTPTLKLKRNEILRQFQSEIDAMYAGH